MDTASHTGAIMGVMLATMGAMEAMAMVAIMVLDTDTMVESDVAMGTVPLCLALLENRKIRNIYIFFVKSQLLDFRHLTTFSRHHESICRNGARSQNLSGQVVMRTPSILLKSGRAYAPPSP